MSTESPDFSEPPELPELPPILQRPIGSQGPDAGDVAMDFIREFVAAREARDAHQRREAAERAANKPLFPDEVIEEGPKLRINIPGGFAYGELMNRGAGRFLAWFHRTEVTEGQGQGKGGYLILRFLQEAVKRGASEMHTFVVNPTALRAYKRMFGDKITMDRPIGGHWIPQTYDDAHAFIEEMHPKFKGKDGSGVFVTIDLTDPEVLEELNKKPTKPTRPANKPGDKEPQAPGTDKGAIVTAAGGTALAEIKSAMLQQSEDLPQLFPEMDQVKKMQGTVAETIRGLKAEYNRLWTLKIEAERPVPGDPNRERGDTARASQLARKMETIQEAIGQSHTVIGYLNVAYRELTQATAVKGYLQNTIRGWTEST